MKNIIFTLLLFTPFCIQKSTTDVEVPGLLQVCSDDLWRLEKEIGVQPWWGDLVRHVKKNHPGYCLLGLQVVNLPDKLVVSYQAKSPDGEKIETDSISYDTVLSTSR